MLTLFQASIRSLRNLYLGYWNLGYWFIIFSMLVLLAALVFERNGKATAAIADATPAVTGTANGTLAAIDDFDGVARRLLTPADLADALNTQTASDASVLTRPVRQEAQLVILISAGQIKMQPRAPAHQLQLVVQNQEGETVYDSGLYVSGELIWSLIDSYGVRLKGGAYHYRVTLRGANGETLQTQTGALIVEQNSEQFWLTTKDEAALGSGIQGGEFTGARADGRSLVGFRVSEDNSTKREIKDGDLIGEKGNKLTDNKKTALQEKASLLGTANRVAKFDVGGVNLVDSAMADTGHVTIDSSTNLQAAGLGSLIIEGQSNKERVELRSAGSGPGPALQGKGFGGTIAAPTATLVNTDLFIIGGSGHNSSNLVTFNAGTIKIKAEQTWTPTANGAYINFETTPSGSTTAARAERMRITGDGNVGIGTTTPTSKLHVVGDTNLTGNVVFSGSLTGNGAGLTNLTGANVTGAVANAANAVNATNAANATNATSAGSFSGLLLGDVTGTQVNTTVGKLQNVKLPAPVVADNGKVLKYKDNGVDPITYEWAADANSGGTVTNVTASAPLASSGGATPNVSLTGIVSVANGGTGSGAAGSAGQFLKSNGTVFAPANITAADVSGVVDTITAQAIGGAKTFSNAVNTTADYQIGGARVLSIAGSNNLFTGASAGASNTTGSFNTFLGSLAGSGNSTGGSNTFIGGQSGASNSTGANNTFSGTFAGFANTTGNGNSFYGSQAGSMATTGSGNAFFGASAGQKNTTAGNNSFFGGFAGFENITGASNAFFGTSAGQKNTTGGFNAVFGAFAGVENTTGSSNAFFGMFAGNKSTTGGSNSFFGRNAGFNTTIGTQNVFVGNVTGAGNTTGNSNTFVGSDAGNGNTIESENTFVGAFTKTTAGITNATAIGARAQAAQNNTLVLGSIAGINGAGTTVNVGIGTNTPSERLDVSGNIQMSGQFNKALRHEATVDAAMPTPNPSAPNVIAGFLGTGSVGVTPGNRATAGVVGATIGGGGFNGILITPSSTFISGDNTNRVTDWFGTVSGGFNNVAGNSDATLDNAIFSVVGGGSYNTASGYSSTVSGGNNNSASGFSSSVGGGEGNVASGTDAKVGGGGSNSASGQSDVVSGGTSNTANSGFFGTNFSESNATVAGGGGNNAHNAYATVSGGVGNTASGYDSTVGGGGFNIASGHSSVVPGGFGAKATHWGELAFSSFATDGDAQTSIYTLRGETFDITLDELYLWQNGGFRERLTVAPGRVFSFDILVTGKTTAGLTAGYRIYGVIKNVGGTTSFVGTPVVSLLGEDVAAWNVTATADDTLDALIIFVNGSAGATVRWLASVRTAELSF